MEHLCTLLMQARLHLLSSDMQTTVVISGAKTVEHTAITSSSKQTTVQSSCLLIYKMCKRFQKVNKFQQTRLSDLSTTQDIQAEHIYIMKRWGPGAVRDRERISTNICHTLCHRA